MVISERFQNEIEILWYRRKYLLLKEKLFNYRMRNYTRLSMIEDKVLIDYKMAYLEYIEGNKEGANLYFEILEDIFQDEYNRDSMELQYYKYKWLKVNNNKETLTNNEIIDEMTEIYEYYDRIGDEEMKKMAYGNIIKFKGDEEEFLNVLEYILTNKKLTKNFLNSTLKDCADISHNLYIKALEIIKKYYSDEKII